jgi:SAM-dependent methyltransferase
MLDAPATFAADSANYAASRPRYPRELFRWIAGQCHEHRCAWDCATGNGQAAIELARDFERVEATDVSAEQRAEAFPSPNVNYSLQASERTAFPDSEFDLIAVAQALHWFDYELFWPEVRRVAKPGAFFCVWGYAWFEPAREHHGILAELHRTLIEPMCALLLRYWAANNRILWDGYADADIRFPFQRIAAPELAISLRWSVEQLIGYVHSWSAYKRAAADPAVITELSRLEEAARGRFAEIDALPLRLPLTIVAGRVP